MRGADVWIARWRLSLGTGSHPALAASAARTGAQGVVSLAVALHRDVRTVTTSHTTAEEVVRGAQRMSGVASGMAAAASTRVKPSAQREREIVGQGQHVQHVVVWWLVVVVVV